MAVSGRESIPPSILDELRPRTLFDWANAIAVRVDGAVVIEDAHLRVVAYSSLDHAIDDARRATILSRQIPEVYASQLDRAGVSAHLDQSPEPVRFDLQGDGFLPRLAIALRRGNETIGLLWVITDDAKEADARAVLVETAPAVATSLERYLTTDLNRASDRIAAAAQLFDGRPVANLPELVGTANEEGFVALAVQPVDDAPDAERDPVGRTAQFATVYVDAFRLPALVAPVTSPWVDIAVVLGGPVTTTRTRDVLRELVDRASAAFGISLRGAMGTVAPDVRGLVTSRRDAAATLDVLATATGNATAAYEEVHSRIALREMARAVRGSEHLSRGRVHRLLRSDSTADRLLVDTVTAYVDANGDVARVAAALGVHRNTIRNRIARFESLAAVDMSDATDRLVVSLQLIR